MGATTKLHDLSLYVSMRQLRMLVAVVENGSVMGAARALNLAQPAVSRSLRDLETILKIKLFERSSQGMIPTSFGEALLRRARTVLAELRDAAGELQALAGGSFGHLRIGCTPLLRAGILPELIATFSLAQTGLTLSVVDDSTDRLLEKLRMRELDVVLARLPYRAHQDKKLQFTALFADTLLLVVGQGHPLARRRRVSLRTAVLDPLVVPDRSSSPMFRAAVEETFSRLERSLPVSRIEAPSPLFMLELAEIAGMAALIPASVMADKASRYRIRTVPLIERLNYGPIGYIRNVSRQGTPALALFLDFLHQRMTTFKPAPDSRPRRSFSGHPTAQ